MAKINCWEHFKDDKTYDCEHCRAYKLDLGTTCYMCKGTKCFGETQGEYLDKIAKCRKCEYYRILFKK